MSSKVILSLPFVLMKVTDGSVQYFIQTKQIAHTFHRRETTSPHTLNFPKPSFGKTTIALHPFKPQWFPHWNSLHYVEDSDTAFCFNFLAAPLLDEHAHMQTRVHTHARTHGIHWMYLLVKDHITTTRFMKYVCNIEDRVTRIVVELLINSDHH